MFQVFNSAINLKFWILNNSFRALNLKTFDFKSQFKKSLLIIDSFKKYFYFDITY